jgi:hypothetical protein
MENIFVSLLFGHVVGDYFLQSKKMALIKSEKTLKGDVYCLLHSIIYSLSVIIFFNFDFKLFVFVLITHWIIDKYSLGDKWLKIIKGRDFVKAYQEKEKYWEIDLMFSGIVYVVVDNFLHIIIAYYFIQNFLS